MGLPARAVELEREQQLAPLGVRQLGQRAAVEPEQVEDHVGHRHLRGEPLDLALVAHVHPPLERLEARPRRVRARVERDDLAVEDRAVLVQRAVQPSQLRIAAVMSDPERERSDSRPGSEWQSARTPSHLTSYDQPAPAGSVPARASIGGRPSRHRLGVRIERLAHPVDHPVALVLALAPDREQRPAAGQVLAVELDLDLARLPDERLERPAVVDPHPARAVLAGRDVAVEVEVLDRMVLGADREPVVAGGRGRKRGSAHEARTPSCLDRRSQCRRVASCSWTTKRGAPRRARGRCPGGSGVSSGCASFDTRAAGRPPPDRIRRVSVLVRYPPATAGRICTSAPSATGVSSAAPKRMSSPPT